MELHRKKILAATLVAMTSPLCAEGETEEIRNIENRLSALELRKGSNRMINPSARPHVRDGADLFVFGDVLYWNAHENGLQVAVKNTGASDNLSDSQMKSVHGKWNVGFRAGIGYNMTHDGWDLRLTWLRFTDNGRTNSNTGGDTFIFPTRVHPDDPLLDSSAAATKFKSKWRMRLDQLDLDLGRSFFVSKWLTLRPHMGVRTDWLHQSLNAAYKNFIAEPLPNQINVTLKDRWWGIGLEGGLDTEWGLGSGWSIFGDLCAAILYGFHHMKYQTQDIPSGFEFVDMRNIYRVSHPILDLEMGVRWDKMLWNDRLHLGLQVGWEHHIYFSQNQFPVFVDDVSLGSLVSNQGDLSLQGWTFSARFDF